MSDQPLLATDDDTYDGESAYDIGRRHALEGHEYYPDRLPKKQRRLYSRGYARGAVEAAQQKGKA